MKGEEIISMKCFAINMFLELGPVAKPDTLKYFTQDAINEAIGLAIDSPAITEDARQQFKNIRDGGDS